MINFAVGPVQSDEVIRNIGSEQVPYFRTASFSTLMKENEKMTLSLMNGDIDSRVVFLTCSGTGAMESSIMNLLNKDDKVLAINGGSFGNRFCQMLKLHNIDYEAICPQVGHGITLEDLTPYDNKGFSAFVVNMHETSTGVLYDMELISDFCKRENIFLIVDAISCFLADPIDFKKWNIGALIIASQKALALPPGLSAVALSLKAIERCKKISCPCMYFDYPSYLLDGERGQTPFTPAVQQLIQLNARLKEILEKGGVEKIISDTKELAMYFRSKIEKYGFKMFSTSPSNAVTSIETKIDAHALFEKIMNEYGIWICPNGGELKNKVFRVGHIGDLYISDYDKLFLAFDDLQQKGELS